MLNDVYHAFFVALWISRHVDGDDDGRVGQQTQGPPRP